MQHYTELEKVREICDKVSILIEINKRETRLSKANKPYECLIIKVTDQKPISEFTENYGPFKSFEFMFFFRERDGKLYLSNEQVKKMYDSIVHKRKTIIRPEGSQAAIEFIGKMIDEDYKDPVKRAEIERRISAVDETLKACEYMRQATKQYLPN